MARTLSFPNQARAILDLPVAHRVNDLGGYGPNGEVVYLRHPFSCPSVLVDKKGDATLTAMSNGSLDLAVKQRGGMDLHILRGHFDPVGKRETGPPSHNVWLRLGSAAKPRVVSLVNPKLNHAMVPESIKIVKVTQETPAFWYCAEFKPGPKMRLACAVQIRMLATRAGPAVLRQVYLQNTGARSIKGQLWTYFDTRGTQEFVYNKEIWYDMGLPLSPRNGVVSCAVPYSTEMQIKRISSRSSGPIRLGNPCCDYSGFVGDSGDGLALPAAVRAGHRPARPSKLNRFSTPTIFAQPFEVNLPGNKHASIEQSLLYVLDRRLVQRFRQRAQAREPNYRAAAMSYRRACRDLVLNTPAVSQIAKDATRGTRVKGRHPDFECTISSLPIVQEYANSVWAGVEELYQNCRAHGAKLAQGIELGTRDRAQDMWPMTKKDPARVRRDLVHLFGFMYYHTSANLDRKKALSLPEKLHGMFPRQYPSQWDNRNEEVHNDNRPYADSALWPIDALVRYLKETGDVSVLLEKVTTIRLTDPGHPVTSSAVSGGKSFLLAEIPFLVLASYQRHAKDSPYGIPQTMYGDWCDPIDMFGTNPVGDAESRGKGRGGNIRLAAHVCVNAVAVLDLFGSRSVRRALGKRMNLTALTKRLEVFANRLRKSIIQTGWEAGRYPGFVDYIHECKKNGRKPSRRRGETGYTFGSMRGSDCDGAKRRALLVQAWCLEMLRMDRPYLTPVKNRESMVRSTMDTVDRLLYDKTLGLRLFAPAVANNEVSLKYVGRMGILPPGTAENGEYHHGQIMMHCFRMRVPGQTDTAWKQFRPVISAMRGTDLKGPFESPASACASDRGDPHFGAGMYFGLSGSVDWIVEMFEKMAGVQLNLHNPDLPGIVVEPNLPAEFQDQFVYKRTIHVCTGTGQFRKIPLTVKIEKAPKKPFVRVNGRPVAKASIGDLSEFRQILVEIGQ